MSITLPLQHICSILLLVLWHICFTLAHSEQTLLMLISCDGFRWDYLDKVKEAGHETPHFDSFIENGVKAKFVKNSFATKTFPNHYTIATGMYEENHGVVGNHYYDPVYKEEFSLSNPKDDADPRWWNNGTEGGAGPEPIWITNQKGEMGLVPRRSGVFFWPGSMAPIEGQTAFRYKDYDSSVPYKERVETLIGWFATEDQPINLGLVYFENPDKVGHRYGPDSQEVINAILELDDIMGYIFEQLALHHLDQHMNIVVTSDHGMASTPGGNFIELDQHIDRELYTSYGGSPVMNIMPVKDKEEEVFHTLKKIPHLHVWRKTEIPGDFHYTHNRRIMPIIIEAEEGYNLALNLTNYKFSQTEGNHGYNNSLPSMHPFFLAQGPAFKKGYLSEPFNNVDIYGLLCEILHIEPHAYDGSLQIVSHMLKSEEEGLHVEFSLTAFTFLGVVVFAGLISGVMGVAACRVHRIHIRRRRGIVQVPLSNVVEGHVHLLAESSEEEIP